MNPAPASPEGTPVSLLPRPAFDPELHALLAGMPLVERMDEEILAQVRALPSPSADSLLAGRRVVRREVDVPAEDGTVVRLSVLSPADRDPAVPAPCVYWMHGGGMVLGDRFGQIDIPLEWLERFGAVVVTVEYRLAPEATGTSAVEDCHRGLAWWPRTARSWAWTPAVSWSPASARAGVSPPGCACWPATSARPRSRRSC